MDKSNAEKKRQPSIVEDRRIGIFAIAESTLRHRPDLVMKLLADVVIVECRLDYAGGCFRYVGYARFFGKVRPSDQPPHYAIACVTVGCDYSIRFEDVEVGNAEVDKVGS